MNTEQMQERLSGTGLLLGVDVGSTTAKIVLLDDGKLLFSCYERHFSLVRQKTLELVQRASELIGDRPVQIAVSGSAGMGVARAADIPFVQEVFATGEAVRRLEDGIDTVVELGGEDAKVIFFGNSLDERMNGTCAGGTGAFIDQMATLMDVTPEELDRLSLSCERLYPIASRCGVFAKSDIQPLLNQGARKEDIAASIYQAVVDQTITGLAQGRRIRGKVLFLGGPLYYCKGLQKRFVETLDLSEENAIFPEYGRLAVAIGAALCATGGEPVMCGELIERLSKSVATTSASAHLQPLFSSKEEYDAFVEEHAKADAPIVFPEDYIGDAYLGIDCGSTTTKLVLLTDDARMIYAYYSSNRGDPVGLLSDQLKMIFDLCGDQIHIRGSAVTGYGEELVQSAFGVDCGLVETIAHYTAARHFDPEVEFILDIGGQDIKCFCIRNRSIDSIMLNEACSSGCGSFLETFAKSLGYNISDFAHLGLFAKAPVDLGTRCTVFMNSSVKQAQKDGATVEDISAGLSMSVVKNALYKVIRVPSADMLGTHIVVQGGTFHNDAVLRCFEREIGRTVVRPKIAGLMGAFGAALYAQAHAPAQTTLITPQDLANFTHTSSGATCQGCGNHCRLTVNRFSGGRRYISGNRCERGAGLPMPDEDTPNLYRFKRERLEALAPVGNGETIGLPLALGMYELAPFWHALFTKLGFRVVTSGLSTRAYYAKGQYSIPSDTACYPAKLMHGHIEELLEKKVDAIFYPCLTYNVDDHTSDNHYNCPVVAYYSELLASIMVSLSETRFLYPYLNINSDRELAKELGAELTKAFGRNFGRRQMMEAVHAARAAYRAHMDAIAAEGKRALEFARSHHRRVMILAGRPYHVDPEINHGIDKLAESLGFVVVSEDSVYQLAEPFATGVLNQWVYHARMYRAARYAVEHDDCELVQLVSFGCGLDAITTDEVRDVLEAGGKLYTQIKIDEITNLGAVKIRLRSLLGALEERDERRKTNTGRLYEGNARGLHDPCADDAADSLSAHL
jgi:predicted CoA-substrate-specific enzyme activase